MKLGQPHRTDIVIIGAGPVGLFAVFQFGMLKMKCHVIDSLEEIGGQCTALYPEKPIYDIPGYPSILAGDLIKQLEEQAQPFQPVFHLSQKVMGLNRGNDSRFRVTTTAGVDIDCAAVVIATSSGAFGPNRPPLENLTEYEGKSVFYMVRKREDFRDKTVVIAGGGDSAVDWAISLSEVAKKIYFVHRRDKFRAAPDSVDKLNVIAVTGKIEMMIPYQLQSLEGKDGLLSSVTLADLENREKKIAADVLLPFFGIVPQTGAMADWGVKLENHRILVDPATMRTNLEGVFAIGDVAQYTGKLKLILTGFSEAAVAAHAAYPLLFGGREVHFIYSTMKGVN